MTKMFSNKFLAITIFCLLFGIGQIFAQGGAATGQITGVVSDVNGAIVPNAAVTITNKGTNQTQTANTSDEGVYRFVLLQPGTYTVKASAASFAEQSLDVEVQVGRATDANFTLGAGAVGAEVTVTAEGVQTTSSQSDAVLNETAINSLPINGRRFQDFVTLTPTAQVDPSRGQISLSGQRGINTNINVDGVDYNQPFFGGIRGGERSNLAFTIPQESIKEFQVVAAGYSAEFGRSSGGIVNAVTKSGDNSLRGSLFYLLRPSRLARGNEFSQALQEQRLAAAGFDATLAPTQQQFGGSVGGPIIKDRIFYFASYEQQRFRAPRQVLFGNLAGFALPASATGPVTPTAPAVTAAQQSARQGILDFFRGLETPFEQTNDAYALLGRIDWNISNNNRFNVRYNFSKNDAVNAVSTGENSLDPTTGRALSTNGIEGNRNNIGVAQLITNLGASTVNELRLQFAREERPRQANEEVPNVFLSFAEFGTRNFLPTTQFDTRYQIADALTYVSGNHTFKFGGEYSRLFASQNFGFNQFGAYSLSIGGQTGTIDIINRLTNVSPVSGVLGRFDDNRARYNRQIGNLEAAFKVHELAFFAQDSWRVMPKFTLNYGLRVEQQYNPEPEATNEQLINVVRNTNFPIRGGGFDPTQIPDSGFQFGPRLGFAYDPEGNGKTVIRGFSGIYYARTPLLIFADSLNNYRSTPGNVSTTLPFVGFSQTAFNTFAASTAGAQYRAITGCVPPAAGQATPAACVPNTVFRQFAIAGINLNNSTLNNLPNVTPEQIGVIASGLGLPNNPFVGAQVTGHAEDFKNPRSYQFGFGVEREVASNFVVGIDYSFVKTDRLQRNRDLNLPAPITAAQYAAQLQAANSSTPAGAPTSVYNRLVELGIIDQLLTANRPGIIAINTPAGIPTTVTFPGVVNSSGQLITFNVNGTTRLRPTNDPTLNPNNRFNLGAVQVRESTAKSLFQGLTFRARLVRKWGQLNAYYTLSKSESDDDNERDSGGVGFSNPYDLSGEYGPSRLDRTHQFVANPVFFLPYGFEVSSAIRLRSGTPINATAGGDLNGDSVNNDRPLLVPGIELTRNFYRNNSIYDVDLRVQKGFGFGERRRLLFTAEFFNLLNRANVLLPQPNTATSSGFVGQYCTTVSQLCGISGITNVNFLQIREQNPTSSNFGNLAINNNINPGSQVFQVQLGARFQF